MDSAEGKDKVFNKGSRKTATQTVIPALGVACQFKAKCLTKGTLWRQLAFGKSSKVRRQLRNLVLTVTFIKTK